MSTPTLTKRPGSVTELVALIQKDRCTSRFFEFCRQGHQLDFQNPFLTWYAFMKLDEHLDLAYPEGSNKANKCDWTLYKGSSGARSARDANISEKFRRRPRARHFARV